jgi:hypothetical protein
MPGLVHVPELVNTCVFRVDGKEEGGSEPIEMAPPTTIATCPSVSPVETSCPKPPLAFATTPIDKLEAFSDVTKLPSVDEPAAVSLPSAPTVNVEICPEEG